MDIANPTAQVDLDFGRYLVQREGKLAGRMVGGVPDYAFGLDYQLRQNIAAVGPVRTITQALVSMVVPVSRQEQLLTGVAVGPQQYPEIYAMGEDCARILGIGIPQIFIYHSPTPNAYTLATDDVEPIVVLSSALIDVMEPLEQKFVIGHECGHIHNLHGVYNTAVEIMVNPLARAMLDQLVAAGVAINLVKTINHVKLIADAIQGGLRLFFMHWSRCAEITCDRAGVICCGDTEAAQTALAKLVIGGSDRLKGFNMEEYLRQLRRVTSPLRLMELTSSHPLISRRIEAIRLFADCEVLHAWRPELRTAAGARSKAETDQLCEQFLNVFAKSTPNLT